MPFKIEHSPEFLECLKQSGFSNVSPDTLEKQMPDKALGYTNYHHIFCLAVSRKINQLLQWAADDFLNSLAPPRTSGLFTNRHHLFLLAVRHRNDEVLFNNTLFPDAFWDEETELGRSNRHLLFAQALLTDYPELINNHSFFPEEWQKSARKTILKLLLAQSLNNNVRSAVISIVYNTYLMIDDLTIKEAEILYILFKSDYEARLQLLSSSFNTLYERFSSSRLVEQLSAENKINRYSIDLRLKHLVTLVSRVVFNGDHDDFYGYSLDDVVLLIENQSVLCSPFSRQIIFPWNLIEKCTIFEKMQCLVLTLQYEISDKYLRETYALKRPKESDEEINFTEEEERAIHFYRRSGRNVLFFQKSPAAQSVNSVNSNLLDLRA